MLIDLSVVSQIILATHIQTETNAEQELDLQAVELFYWNAPNTGVMSIGVKIIIVGFSS